MKNKMSHLRTDLSHKSVLLLLVLLLGFGIVISGTAVAQEDPPPPPDTFPMEHPGFPGVYIMDRVVTGDQVETTLAIPVQQDAFLSSGQPNTNFGSSTSLNIGWSNNSNLNAMRFILQFDLSAIPANATINNATFNIWQTSAVPANDFDFGLQAQFMRQAWSENSVTWNNANFLGSTIIGVGFTNNASGWKTFNATQVVSTWYSGSQANFGAIFTGAEGPAENRSRVFFSGNQPGSDCGNPFGFGCRPYLVVTINEQNCDNIPPTATVGVLPQWSPQAFTVTWSGFDSAPSGCPPTGIANYSVQYSLNNGASWIDWQNFTTATSATFSLVGNGQFVQFRARARDLNENAPPWSSVGAQASTTVDTLTPNATVNPLPEFSLTSGTITWTGSDNLSGIRTYDVQFRVNGGPWELLVQNAPVSQTSFAYSGAPAGFFELRARATDNVGNIQPWGNPQASTTVVTNPVAEMNPISPSIVTDPSATSIPISWTVEDLGYNVIGIEIWVRQGLGGWTRWSTFSGSTRNATYNFGTGDRAFQFEAVALASNSSNDEPRNSTAEASFILDQEAPFVLPIIDMPVVFNTTQ